MARVRNWALLSMLTAGLGGGLAVTGCVTWREGASTEPLVPAAEPEDPFADDIPELAPPAQEESLRLLVPASFKRRGNPVGPSDAEGRGPASTHAAQSGHARVSDSEPAPAPETDIGTLIKARNPEILACFEGLPLRLAGNGVTQERVTLEFGIDERGHVRTPSVSSDRASGPRTHVKCIEGRLRNWRFPARKHKGTLLVTHVFRYVGPR